MSTMDAAEAVRTLLSPSATHDPGSGQLAVFALNRHLHDEQALRVELRGFDRPWRLATALQLHHPDMQAVNTQAAPDTVVPVPHGGVQLEPGGLAARLAPGSWNVFVLQPA